MKEIVAADQVRLGVGRCLQLAWSGLGHRLFRSSVTVAILLLAVAFLGHMLAFGVLEQTTLQQAHAELGRERALGEMLTRATTPDTESAILLDLGQIPVSSHWEEHAAWSGWGRAELSLAAGGAHEARVFAAYVARLPPAAKAAICGDASADELLEELRDPARFERFEVAVQAFGLREPLFAERGDERAARDALRQLVNEGLPKAKRLAHDVAGGHAAAIFRVTQALGQRSPALVARDAPLELRDALRGAGFQLCCSLEALSAFARRRIAAEELDRALLKGNLRAEVARATDLAIGDVSSQSVLDYVGSDETRARWLSELVKRSAQLAIPPALMREIASSSSRLRALSRAVGDVPPEASYLLGISGQSRWLVALSFLVCAVGVANAMLMSVTERFTEIATMKCLGALDGFVMTLFLFEAVIEGALGGAVGVLLGALLAWLRGVVEYGSVLSAAGAAGYLMSGLALSWLAGMVLAALAAVGPSFVAARLAPMEAMRVD